MKLKRYKLFITVTLSLVFLDLMSKLLVDYYLPENLYYDPIPVIPPFLYLAHVHNTGAAWGMFADKSYILAIIGLLALYMIYAFRKVIELHKTFVQWSMGLLCAGIIGNMIDRVAYAHVNDFIDVHLPGGYRWPTFNFADCGITVGVTLFIIISFFAGKK